MRNGLPDAVRRRLDPGQRYGLRLTLLAIAVVLVAVPFGVLLEQVVRSGPLVRFDTWAANHLHDWVDSSLFVAVLQFVSFLGKPIWFYVVCGAVTALLWLRHLRRLAIYLVVTTLLGGLIDTIVKVLVARPRPSLEDPVATAFGKSFPSGHAMTSLVAYGALLLIFLPVISRRRRPIAIAVTVVLVLAIGISRLFLGVHYISDVVGGWVLGLAWLSGATAAFEIWRQERGKRPTAPLEEGLEPEAAPELHARANN